jgi:hypothetical protein
MGELTLVLGTSWGPGIYLHHRAGRWYLTIHAVVEEVYPDTGDGWVEGRAAFLRLQAAYEDERRGGPSRVEPVPF